MPAHHTPAPVAPNGIATSPGNGAEPSSAARPRGRPALDGRGGSSPRVAFRVPAEVKLALQRLARATGRRESDLAREALERFLAGGA